MALPAPPAIDPNQLNVWREVGLHLPKPGRVGTLLLDGGTLSLPPTGQERRPVQAATRLQWRLAVRGQAPTGGHRVLSTGEQSAQNWFAVHGKWLGITGAIVVLALLLFHFSAGKTESPLAYRDRQAG